jgi:hypothetical protein
MVEYFNEVQAESCPSKPGSYRFRLLKLSDRGETVHSVTGESADGLCNDQVYLPGEGVVDHRVETFTVSCVESRDALVSVDSGKLPFGV